MYSTFKLNAAFYLAKFSTHTVTSYIHVKLSCFTYKVKKIDNFYSERHSNLKQLFDFPRKFNFTDTLNV